MTTRILLHGGNADRRTDKNEKFFNEIIDGVALDTIRILCIYFARPEHRWEDSYDEDQYMFRRVADERSVEIQTSLASYDMDDLAEKITESDVIFINGGMKGHLKDTLLSFGLERFRQLVEGKTLVGISAGANVLTRYYYSMAIGGIREGTGFLNIKLLTHYSHDEPEKLQNLKDFGEDLPIATIAEEEYIVVNDTSVI
jgi:peptidase E